MTRTHDLKEITARAARAFAGSDHDAALQILDEALDEAGAFPPFLRLKARILLARGELAAALVLVDALPDTLRTGKLVDTAMRVYLDAGLTARATDLLDRVPQDARSDQSCQLAAIWLAERTGSGVAALALARRYHQAHPRRAQILKEYVRLARLHGDKAAMADVLHGAIARDPQPAYVRELAKLHSDMGASDAAFQVLEAHGALADTHPWWHLARLDALAVAGLAAACIAAAEEAAQAFPRDPRINERLWQVLARAGRRRDAIAACRDFAVRMAGAPQVALTCAQFLTEAGEIDAANTLVEGMEGAADGTAKSLAVQAKLRFLQHDALSAMALAQRARDLPGAPLEATRTLARAERALGDHDAAIARLDAYLSEMPNDPGACIDAAESCGAIGDFARAEAFLARVPAGTVAVQPRLHALRARFLLAQNRFEDALAACAASMQANPRHAAPLMLKALCELLTGRVAAAWETQAAFTRLRATEDLSGRVSRKPRKSVLGHLINEYRLLGPDPDLAHCAPGADHTRAAQVFCARLADNPDSTVFALCQLAALCRTDAMSATAPTVPADAKAVIPRRITQFWDSADLPEQIAWTMARNRQINPGYAHLCMNEADAVVYLRDKGEARALRGFRLAQAAAQKSDILRLAILYHDGGVYMDADDRCLEPLDNWLDLRLDFIGYQEFYRSIGNNFLAARPGLAMFRDALDQAAEASLGPQGETLWLSTGPGAVTRALARNMTGQDGQLAPGVWVMPDHRLRRSVAPHTRLSYKGTSNHWVKQFLRADADR